MLIVHEGLPGSGKSFEAAKNQIIPALKKGRKIFAYIEGLNYEKFAEITGLDLEIVQALLISLTKEQVPTIHRHVENDSLVIIDELQDFFPAHKKQLDAGITEFVTQHRHRGIDIVAMGQNHKDFSVLWKRRIDMLIRFMKRDALGMPTSYTWTTYKQQGEKFVKIRSGSGKYDSAYFGLYASHNAGVTAIDLHDDDRINIFRSSVFRVWLPVFLLLFCYAIYYVWGLFHNGLDEKQVQVTAKEVKSVQVQVQPQPQPIQVQAQKPLVSPQPLQPSQPEKPTQKQLNSYKGYLDYYFVQYRPRLAVLFVSKSQSNKIHARIEFYDQDGTFKDAFTVPQLNEFGYSVRRTSVGLVARSLKGEEFVIKAWERDLDTKYKSYDRRDERHDDQG